MKLTRLKDLKGSFAAWLSFFLFLSLFADIVRSQSGLECYVCGKSQPRSCEEFDPNQRDFRTTCPPDMESCVKTYGAFGNVTVIGRRCGDGAALNKCTAMTLGGAEVNVCSCDQPLCNSAPSLANSAVTLLGVTGYLFMWRRVQLL